MTIRQALSLLPPMLLAVACTPSGASDADGDVVSYSYRWTVNGVASGTGAALTRAFAQHTQFGPQAHNRIAQLEHDFVLRGHVALEVGDFFL
jgi:hypothetical protein